MKIFKYLFFNGFLSILFIFQSIAQLNNPQNSPVNGAFAYQMLDPKIDDPEKPWSYPPKPTTVIGMPFSISPVQVTFDGAIYTGQAELTFFYGEELKPVLARQRTLYEGWIPIVINNWEKEGIAYKTEFFSSKIEGLTANNTIQFAKITVKNINKHEKKAIIASASRVSGGDHRYRQRGKCPPSTRFELAENIFWRDDQFIYSFPVPKHQFAVLNEKYFTPFSAKEYFITVRTIIKRKKYRIDI